MTFLSPRVLVIGSFLVVILGVVFYFAFARVTRLSIAERLLDQQQTLSRAEASNITSFFQTFGDSIAVFSRLGSVKNKSGFVAQNMDAFVEQWRDSDLVGGIVWAGTDAVVQLNSNVLGTSDVGASLADRDYFVWAESAKEGQYYVGEPVISRLGATKGQMIVPVAAPIFREDVFVGVIAASVKLLPLTNQYLEFMRVSDSTDVYLINQDGSLIYSNSNPDLVGSNLFELIEQNPLLVSQMLEDSLKKTLGSNEEGKLQAPYLNTKTQTSEVRLIAWSPVTLNSQNWVLIMATPTQAVDQQTRPVYGRLAALLFLVFLTILTFGVIVSREVQSEFGGQVAAKPQKPIEKAG